MNTALYLAHDAGRVSDLTKQARRLVNYFCSECGFRPLPWMERKFAELLQTGHEVEQLEDIIQITSMAPRPSWAYLAAVVRNQDRQLEALEHGDVWDWRAHQHDALPY